MPSVRYLVAHELMSGRISVLQVMIVHLSWPGNTQGVQGSQRKKPRTCGRSIRSSDSRQTGVNGAVATNAFPGSEGIPALDGGCGGLGAVIFDMELGARETEGP